MPPPPVPHALQVVGGIYAHSLAIITDAAHLLSDVSGFAVAVSRGRRRGAGLGHTLTHVPWQ